MLRRQLQKVHKRKKKSKTPEDHISSFLKGYKKDDEEQEDGDTKELNLKKLVDESQDRIKSKKKKEKVITELSKDTDFLAGIKTETQLINLKKFINVPTQRSLKDTRCGTESVMNVSLPSERMRNLSRNKVSKLETQLR